MASEREAVVVSGKIVYRYTDQTISLKNAYYENHHIHFDYSPFASLMVHLALLNLFHSRNIIVLLKEVK